MDVSLTPEMERLVSARLASARYNSATEVVREALLLLQEHDAVNAARLSAFDEELGSRLSALDRGETGDPTEVRARLQRKSAEWRKQRA